MTETIMPEERLRMIDPQFVVPVVAFLASPANQVETGSIFEAGAGFVRKIRWERSRGLSLNPDSSLNPTALIRRWDEVNSFASSPEHPNVPVLSGLGETGSVSGSPITTNSVSFQGQVAVVVGATR